MQSTLPAPTPILITADRTLEILGWPPQKKDALYRRAREGKFPHVRLGRSIYFNEAAIRQWISNGGTPLSA